MKKIILILYLMTIFSLTAQQDQIILQLNLPVSLNTIKELKTMKQFNINVLQNIVIDSMDQWIEKGNRLGITCQAVTPMGKWIGKFNNPDLTEKSIPGGQSKICNLWLIEKGKGQRPDQLPDQPMLRQPNDKPYFYQLPTTPRYYAL